MHDKNNKHYVLTVQAIKPHPAETSSKIDNAKPKQVVFS